MKLRLICYDGRRYELPRAEAWKFQYGTGTPCDSFEARFPWAEGVDPALSAAVRFEADWEGKAVFRGVVDEFECRRDGGGGSLLLAGRGMAALLLDNEAESADYQVATLEDILRRHVEPYGIQVAARPGFPAVPGFSVESGSSEWQVLRDFARYHGGVEPRFDREGRLVLTPPGDEKRLLVDERAAVLALKYRERRYGVLSEVLVRDRTRQTVQRVENKEFIARGGRCRRSFTMPGKSSYQAMRYSGQFQLEQSAAERARVELTLPEPFAAWPGELVEIRREKRGAGGSREIRQGADEKTGDAQGAERYFSRSLGLSSEAEDAERDGEKRGAGGSREIRQGADEKAGDAQGAEWYFSRSLGLSSVAEDAERDREKPKFSGLWRVLESETGAGEQGTYTRLTLGER